MANFVLILRNTLAGALKMAPSEAPVNMVAWMATTRVAQAPVIEFLEAWAGPPPLLVNGLVDCWTPGRGRNI